LSCRRWGSKEKDNLSDRRFDPVYVPVYLKTLCQVKVVFALNRCHLTCLPSLASNAGIAVLPYYMRMSWFVR
jgi:hypothetical protein